MPKDKSGSKKKKKKNPERENLNKTDIFSEEEVDIFLKSMGDPLNHIGVTVNEHQNRISEQEEIIQGAEDKIHAAYGQERIIEKAREEIKRANQNYLQELRKVLVGQRVRVYRNSKCSKGAVENREILTINLVELVTQQQGSADKTDEIFNIPIDSEPLFSIIGTKDGGGSRAVCMIHIYDLDQIERVKEDEFI